MEQAKEIFNLGCCYYSGINDYPLNKKRAADLFMQAASMGYSAAIAQIALMYENGEVLEKSISKAIDNYTKAYNLDENYSASYNLGRIYYCGLSVPKDVEKAIKYFNKCIEKGPSESQKIYAYSCEYMGLIFTDMKRYLDAAGMYRRAIQYADCPVSWHNLAYFYESKYISDRSFTGKSDHYVKALRYYRTAADMGYAQSMFSVGRLLHMFGDLQKAKEWYHKAYIAGYAPAERSYKLLRFAETKDWKDLY